MATDATSWPRAGQDLLAELRRAPGRLCLVVDDPPGGVIAAVSEVADAVPLSVGRAVTESEPPRSVEALITLLEGETVLIDLDVLFWPPWLRLDPVGLLRTLSRRTPGVVSQWPGTTNGRELAYSVPGRRDHFRATVDDVVLLRPRHRDFPDEVPYTAERM